MTKPDLDSESHNKPCTLCSTPRPVLVRCQIDDTGKWHFVCPGKCWQSVSGGEIDAKGHEAEHPYYKYGGMWKNRHADGPLNAKKPKKSKKQDKDKDQVVHSEGRKTHNSEGDSEDGNEIDSTQQTSAVGVS